MAHRFKKHSSKVRSLIITLAVPHGSEADALCRIADAQHRYPLAGDEGSVAKRLQGIPLSVVSGNHLQARRATVYRVVLAVVGEEFYHR